VSAQCAPNAAFLQRTLNNQEEGAQRREAIMAGRSKAQEARDSALDRIAELESELNKYKGLLAIHAPNAILDQLAPPMTQYDSELPSKILALGHAGYAEDEMISSLSVARDDWEMWKGTFPDMAAAVSRARDLALGMISRVEREGFERRDWRLPYQTLNARRQSLEKQGISNGDGPSVVRVIKGAHPGSTITNRPSLCARCAADTAGSAPQADPARGSE